MKTFKVTDIGFWDLSHEVQISETETELVKKYSGVVVINDEFCIEVSGNDLSADKPSIASPDVCYTASSGIEFQQFAYENYDINEIMLQIEADGFENNLYYLEENGEKM